MNGVVYALGITNGVLGLICILLWRITHAIEDLHDDIVDGRASDET